MASNVAKNPYLLAGKTLVRHMNAYSKASEFETLLGGDAESATAKAWAATAVILKNGEVQVVPADDFFKSSTSSGGLVRLFSNGTFSGRGLWRNAAWLSENVEKVFPGVLTLP